MRTFRAKSSSAGSNVKSSFSTPLLLHSASNCLSNSTSRQTTPFSTNNSCGSTELFLFRISSRHSREGNQFSEPKSEKRAGTRKRRMMNVSMRTEMTRTSPISTIAASFDTSSPAKATVITRPADVMVPVWETMAWVTAARVDTSGGGGIESFRSNSFSFTSSFFRAQQANDLPFVPSQASLPFFLYSCTLSERNRSKSRERPKTSVYPKIRTKKEVESTSLNIGRTHPKRVAACWKMNAVIPKTAKCEIKVVASVCMGMMRDLKTNARSMKQIEPHMANASGRSSLTLITVSVICTVVPSMPKRNKLRVERGYECLVFPVSSEALRGSTGRDRGRELNLEMLVPFRFSWAAKSAPI
ncbi:hypothetical protein BLNAU_17869 [Blattamonas nauphoetae]|uniref:Uncharacterized protein n=1 Tax=Blattamonas nauphoetae TaxID=2049346 RepID=A0ABQ9X6A8_9EUKA|nr:hypothetical protein BLNAU_17869 [Blattamonas nauphoetae]